MEKSPEPRERYRPTLGLWDVCIAGNPSKQKMKPFSFLQSALPSKLCGLNLWQLLPVGLKRLRSADPLQMIQMVFKV